MRPSFWLLLACLTLVPPQVSADPFSFVVVGDQPYGNNARTTDLYRSLIGAINATDPALVIHVGDTKSGGTLCTDDKLRQQLDFLNDFTAPTLYAPGDNEWTDCHRLVAGAYDPNERLDFIRATYYTDPDTSFGQNPIAVTHQGADGFPENTRVMLDDVMFVTAHVVGSNNSFEATRPETAVEYAARDAANRQWLQDSFAAAKDAKAMVLSIHADMFEFGFSPPWDPEGFVRHSGFRLFAETLVWQAGLFDRPVLLAFGDSHKFRMFRPFPRTAPNIMALETFGDKHMHAVRVHVTPDDSFPFAVQPLINPDQPLTRKVQKKKKKN
ncbi:metallophosphoesterase [uncultured Roseovarius sp.]|uniref:metallophosphoesterase n=1 Tax=uncultured Roseovarius sp. TaxID=293344 RepID=UPI00260E3D8D|nr:metallophosphoesterase [uncultured Roseovarius sp.]